MAVPDGSAVATLMLRSLSSQKTEEVAIYWADYKKFYSPLTAERVATDKAGNITIVYLDRQKAIDFLKRKFRIVDLNSPDDIRRSLQGQSRLLGQ